MKAIEETKQGDPISLYDVYQDEYEWKVGEEDKWFKNSID